MSAEPPTIHTAAAANHRCMFIDRARLGRRVRELARLRQPTPEQGRQIAHIIDLVARSVERREQRERMLPRPMYPNDLPVVAAREQILAAIREHQVVVLCGATGSGKTTQLPKLCLELGRGVSGMIGHTQPRRIAARSVAARIAQELGANLGGSVGYKVRFTDQVSRSTYIKVMTDGILLAETQNDRMLAQYDTLIIDEAHERSLNIDFLLGYIRQLLPKRPDLKLIVTSATIDPQSFAEHFADVNTGKPAPVIEVSGRTYPVEVRYRPLHRGDDDTREIEMEHAVVEAAAELIGADRHDGSGGKDRDILVFLPGEREIRETADELRKAHALRGAEIVPLFARLSTEDQNRIFAPHEGRRIVLATNVAETSLTVPGIRYVIDSGLARISRYSPRIKVQRLPIEPVSQASAMQRSGRCGRTSPGIAIRLYAQDDFDSRPVYTDPEILRTNLASVILQMKALGLTGEGGDVASFPFMQPPDPRAVRDGYDTLAELGAVDKAGELTPIGRKLARLPVDPRIGRMILAAEDERCLGEVLVIAAALSVADPRERPADKQQEADAIHEKWRDEESDFLAYLKLWRGFDKQERSLSGGQLRKWCKANLLSYVRVREWQDIHRQLVELAGELGLRTSERAVSGPSGYDQIHRALLAGLLSNIGQKGSERGVFEYDGVRALKFSIFPGSALFKERPKWVMAAELVRTSRLYARTVARIQPQWIEKVAAHLVSREYTEPHWSGDTAQVGAFETVTLFGLPIIRRRTVHYGPIEPAASRGVFIEHALVKGEYLSSGRFFEANHALERSIKRLEERKRQHDLLADPTARFEFYDKRLPADVYDGPGFERWRKVAERKAPELLVMQKEDLLAPGASLPTPEQFPEAVTVALDGGGSARVGLGYIHKHNDPEDGITATIPAAIVQSVDPQRFEWLVPGLAKEKVVELIRALPKSVRVNLSPAAQFAERAVAMGGFGEGDFLAAIGARLHELGKVHIPEESLAAGLRLLPEHLRMNFRVVEESGGRVRVVGQGRDLERIKRDLAARAEQALAGLPEGAHNRAGITLWDFGRLPETVEVRHRGIVMPAFPALVDETPPGPAGGGGGAAGARVALRVFSTRAKALAAHRRGVNRLLAVQVQSETRSLIEHTPGIQRVLLHASPLGPTKAAARDLAELVGLRAFADVPDLAAIRTPEAFEGALNAGWNAIGHAGAGVIGLAERVFIAHQSVQLAMNGAPAAWAPVVSDVRHQLALLMHTPPGGGGGTRFLIDTPHPWLAHYPRYLSGITRRLEKCVETGKGVEAGIDRDLRLMAELMPLWIALLARLRQVGGITNADAELSEFRWHLEELRVSLFAQELRTSVSVSLKRLAERWETIVKRSAAA